VAMATMCAAVAESVGRSADDVGRAWGAAWSALCAASVGAAFRSQRDLARRSLAGSRRPGRHAGGGGLSRAAAAAHGVRSSGAAGASR
jgi:hypothetical protein